MTEEDSGPTGVIRAAGAVVWRGTEPDLKVALVHRPRYDDWTFPKGRLKPGEHVVAGALREVAEETGITVTLGRSLPPVRYLKGGRPKRVDYWTARAVPTDGPAAPRRGDEVDEVAWLPLEEARRRLTHGPDAALLRALTAAPLATTPLLLVRHGRAGSRQEWGGDDDERPLDEVGRSQAATLAGVLAAYRPARLVSSPSRRCVQTLEPYAGETGLRIRLRPPLSETCYDRRKALRLLSRALASPWGTALCSHGDVLSELIAGAGSRAGDGDLDKGALVVLHHAGGRIAGADRYRT
ncbi:NUDIX hydrolase [Streptosporangium violaceochromogenes]|nr:NUDIX hydrolase [Streptosporangium violaceochromogenes]